MAKKKKTKSKQKTTPFISNSTQEDLNFPSPLTITSEDGATIDLSTCSNLAFNANYVSMELSRGTVFERDFFEAVDLVFLDPATMRKISEFFSKAADWKEAAG